MHPVPEASPMGFAPSSGWAQALTDVVAERAKLPEKSRILPSTDVPESFPLWGSIIDDVWAIDNTSDGHADVVGPSWLHTATGEWEKVGAESHKHKEVDLGEGEEVQ